MSEWIGQYKRLTPMRTAGSGSACWCFATRGLEQFFVKEFLSPVWPAQEESMLGQRQRERCEQFEQQKQRLYTAAACVLGDSLVPVVDFFRFEKRYYAVSEAISDQHLSAEDLVQLSMYEKQRLLYDLALCLQRLHAQGIVHADLKPDHVFLLKRPNGYQLKLIDLDSGFLQDDAVMQLSEMEGDPVYLAPEAFMRMVGQNVPLTTALDVFSFGIMIHYIWTGELPRFDTAKYLYLYEAALDGASISLSSTLPEEYHQTVMQMLNADATLRPDDAQITALFEESSGTRMRRRHRPCNGLSRLMHT